MGVDLRLLPVDYLKRTAYGLWGYSHTVLNVPRRSASWSAWSAFDMLKPEVIPDSVNMTSYVGTQVPDGTSKGEVMYGQLRNEDNYGKQYTWVAAGRLKPLLAEWFPNTPVHAYINALEDDAMIILDWY